jgi:hypothetical protein
MLKQNKIFIILLISLVITSTLVLAKDSAQITNNQVIFSLSSSTGIFHTAYIMKDTQKIDKIQLCNNEKCPGNIKVLFNISSNLSGEYNLAYYSFDDYQMKTLNFLANEPTTKTAQQINNQNANSNRNVQSQETVNSNKNSLFRSATVTTICRLSSIIKGNYQECRDKYL